MEESLQLRYRKHRFAYQSECAEVFMRSLWNLFFLKIQYGGGYGSEIDEQETTER